MAWRSVDTIRLFAATAILALTGVCPGASAEDAPGDTAPVDKAEDAPKGLFERDTLTGDWGGLRTDLIAKGIALNATETGETLGLLSGGNKSGAVYEGRLELDLDLDLDQILGWDNTVFRASAYQIHGRGLSRNYLGGDMLTVSNIEAERALRLFDLWLQRGFLDNALSLRVGQIAADDEFFTSEYANGLMNSTFGWPAILSVALPNGGPAYPLAAPGLRVRYAFSDSVSLQFGLFDGNPSGASQDDDPEFRDPSGTTFNFGGGALMIVEAAYSTDSEQSGTAATAYKIGAWYHSGAFDDLAADGQGTAIPVRHSGNFGAYVGVDQLIYREAETDDLGLGAFLRLAMVPDDRNFVGFYADAGLSYKGLFEGRDGDVMSLGIAWADVGGAATRFDAALQHAAVSAVPLPDHEAAIEISYQAALAPWWTVQPDLQYVLHPTPAVIRPESPAEFVRVRDAVVAGLRTSIRF
jgi:porin